MILLDTNVISETMKPSPSPAVISWLDQQKAETLFLSSVSLAELFFGVAALPQGKRQQQFQKHIETIGEMFKGRVLNFDLDAAKSYAELAVLAKSKGMGFPTPDGYIAAIASSKRLIVASRDAGPFEAAGLNVINPWFI
jgi:predicted nucleic acid-binding protein